MSKKNKGYKEVEIYLSDDEFNWIARQAHEKDITFNKMCCKLLEKWLKKLEKSTRVSGKSTEGIKSELGLTKSRPGKAGTRKLAGIPRRVSKSKRT